MKRYGPQSFLEQYPVSTLSKYTLAQRESVNKNISKFKTWKNMRIFKRYLEYFINIAYESEIKVKTETKNKIKLYTFECKPYKFRLAVSFRVDFEAADNRFGMEKCFIIDYIALEVFETTANILVKYGKLDVWNRYERMFKKFLKKIRKFIQKDDRMNVWFILQGINAERIREVTDGL